MPQTFSFKNTIRFSGEIMNVDVYKSKKSSGPREKTYILVSAGEDIESLPQKVKDQLGELIFFKNIDLVPGKPRIAIDPDQAIQNIQNNGYHIQGTKIDIQIITHPYDKKE